MTPRPLVAALVLCLLTGVSALADTFNVDQDHSQIAWQVDHLGIAQTHGRFDRFSGSFDTSSSPTLTFEIEAKSVNTNSKRRDKHLRNKDFFHVNKHPTITFKSTQATATETGWTVQGELSLLGVTKPMEVQIIKTGEGKTRLGYRAGIRCEFVIRRSEYGMTYGIANGLLGDEIPVRVDIEGIRAKPDA